MYRLIHFLRGYARLQLVGAAPQEVLNRFVREGIAFWSVTREDELHYTCCVWLSDRKRAEQAAERSLCTVTVLWERGLLCFWRTIRRRPVLLVGWTLAAAMCFLLQYVVLFIRVDGAAAVHEEEILRALEEIDIRTGTSTGEIDQQLTKHRMLNLVPELSWIGVNQRGFCLNVSVTERSEAEYEGTPYAAANIVALRQGVVTSVNVFQGMQLCKSGDTVEKGQVLVSAFEDHGIYLRSVCAAAEIYAQTWYSGTVVMPSVSAQKRYTGKEFREVWLIVGRKRIKLCGNSSISLTDCDKMVDVKELTLAEGDSLPLALEITTYRQYTLQTVPVSALAAEDALTEAWLRMRESSMIAGTVVDTTAAILESGGLYVLHAESTCNEMIAQVVPVEAAYEGE